jgi:tungstate transport system substrate-binding protein
MHSSFIFLIYERSFFMQKFKINKFLCGVLVGVTLFSLMGCSKKERSMVLATTTSTQDSGLLDYLLPEFQKDSSIKVNVLAKGTGEALEVAKRGDADCLLVHAKAQEEQFVKDGYGIERQDVMYNDFIIVGPKEDPAKLKEKAPNDALAAFKLLESNQASFISRGDNSGTETKEKSIWSSAKIAPKGNWYISAGKGMGAVLQMADEKKAYTLTDRATYLSMKDKLNLAVLTENGKDLYNQYGVIKLNPQKNKIKEKEADEFIKWILSDKGQKLIGEFGKDKYGQSLFIANAKK